MANLVFFLLLIAGVVALVIHLRRRAERPEQRLRKNFRELKKSILASLQNPARKEAADILDSSEKYLDGLIRARQQQRMLNEMMEAGSELMGVHPGERKTARRQAWGAEQLEVFFSQLSRVAAVVTIKDQDALHELRGFAEDLETQRRILRELTDELGREPDGSGAAFQRFDQRLQESESDGHHPMEQQTDQSIAEEAEA